jgi:DNA polymerase sigma
MARKPLEIRARNDFTVRIVEAIRSFFPLPGHDVKLYGSDAAALGLPISDIDLMIHAPSLHCPNPYMAKEMKVQALKDLGGHFQSLGICVEAKVRDEALIPILEMRCPQSTLEVDLSFEEPHSALALEEVMRWTGHYGHRDILRLLLPLKHALNMRKLGLAEATAPYQVIYFPIVNIPF